MKIHERGRIQIREESLDFVTVQYSANSIVVPYQTEEDLPRGLQHQDQEASEGTDQPVARQRGLLR